MLYIIFIFSKLLLFDEFFQMSKEYTELDCILIQSDQLNNY